MTLTIDARVPGAREGFLDALAAGEISIYPTDTVYGIGCDATDDDAVARIYDIKGRDARPVSVIAPSLEWIHTHCVVPTYAEELLAKLPGAYTFILTLRDTACVAPQVLQGRSALGVRIPAHWCSDIAATFGRPIVTTSANISGEPVMRNVKKLPWGFTQVNLVIDGGELTGAPSTVIDCTGDAAKTLR